MLTRPLVIGTRRRCDNDGKLYTVRRADHRFCRTKCRQEFHQFGSPFLQLRPQICKEIARVSEEIEYRVYSAFDQQTRIRYRAMFPKQARRFDFIEQEKRFNEAAAAAGEL
jgi:hypothetical protein